MGREGSAHLGRRCKTLGPVVSLGWCGLVKSAGRTVWSGEEVVFLPCSRLITSRPKKMPRCPAQASAPWRVSGEVTASRTAASRTVATRWFRMPTTRCGLRTAGPNRMPGYRECRYGARSPSAVVLLKEKGTVVSNPGGDGVRETEDGGCDSEKDPLVLAPLLL